MTSITFAMTENSDLNTPHGILAEFSVFFSTGT